jgi:predicted HTH transcriptional regulator
MELDKAEDLLSLIACDESETVEFKSSFQKEVTETVVAFANRERVNGRVNIIASKETTQETIRVVSTKQGSGKSIEAVSTNKIRGLAGIAIA